MAIQDQMKKEEHINDKTAFDSAREHISMRSARRLNKDIPQPSTLNVV